MNLEMEMFNPEIIWIDVNHNTKLDALNTERIVNP
jgi:hypothetical protein